MNLSSKGNIKLLQNNFKDMIKLGIRSNIYLIIMGRKDIKMKHCYFFMNFDNLNKL